MSNPDIWKYAGKGAPKLRGRPQSPEHVRKRVDSARATLASRPVACKRCGGEFIRTSSSQRYCSGQCWQAEHRPKRESQHRVHVSAASYAALVERFGSHCNICSAPAGGNSRGDRLAVDHCHETGTIRGLLCHRCNTSLGLMRDSPDLLTKAATYLARPSHN